MMGTVLNAVGILIGCVYGLSIRKTPAPANQQLIKLFLGALVVFVGLRLTWTSVGGGFVLSLKQITIAFVAMILGRFTGRLLHLQKLSNRLGQFASKNIAESTGPDRHQFNDGFLTASILFCAAPLAILGSVQDGFGGYWPTLGIKALMDGMAAMAFVCMFGWSVILSIIPVVAFQGTITLLSKLLAMHLQAPLLDSINTVGGLLVFSVVLVILEVKKVELADYLPSLAFAPMLTWLFR